MQLNITARHFKASEALKEFTRKQVLRLKKYYDGIIDAEVILKGTRVDGVFTADPEKDPSARRFERIDGMEVLNRNLRVMDLTAITMCRESRIPIVVFNLNTEGNLLRVATGADVGTIVTSE